MGDRLFTAVIPTPEAQQALDALIAPLRGADPRLRWSPIEKWHVTTSFMGDVPADALPSLRERLAEVAARTPAFTLRLGGAGAFPSVARSKALWLGVRVESDALTCLAGGAGEAATAAGVAVDEKEYRPHLTIARSNRSLDATELVARLAMWEGVSWKVKSWSLMKSQIRERVHRYEAVETYVLDQLV